MAGIFGNLYDRLGFPRLESSPGTTIYAVRDWLHFQIEPVFDWPIFNIADSLLVCGAALLVWHAFTADGRAAADQNDASLKADKSPPSA